MSESYTMQEQANSYELSLWTHSDNFLRLLKGKLNFEGEAYNTIFTRRIDGENELSFSIPLYVYDYENKEMIENPLWSLIFGEKKIRLIRNRGELTESVFDFVIKTFQETRENDIPIMNVTCKSYGLYELNKIGLEIVAFEDSNIGICKSKTPPEFVDKNTIWIDLDNNFYIYTGDSDDDSTDEDLWTLISDVYSGGLPEIATNAIIASTIITTNTSVLSNSIVTSKYNTIIGTVFNSSAIMSYITSVSGIESVEGNSKIILGTINNTSGEILNPTIIIA